MSFKTIFPWLAAAHLAREELQQEALDHATPSRPQAIEALDEAEAIFTACETFLRVTVLLLEQHAASERQQRLLEQAAAAQQALAAGRREPEKEERQWLP